MNIEPRSVPEADMTPMVDATFLLLIFFMVTAAFTMQSAIVVPKPSPPEPVILAAEPELIADIVVEVDEFNTVTRQ